MADSPLWTWRELCDALNLPAVDGPAIDGISIDTRTLAPGQLFIALNGDPGPRFHSSGSAGRDGHEFIPQAVSAGASGILVDQPVDADLPSLMVDDTLDALWEVACVARERVTGQVVAITGSAGKTTARQWLEQVLATQAKTHASTGSLNNHWGVPLSLSRMPRDARYGVFEVGTNNPGEIAPLSSLTRPDVAVLLNVLPAHLGRFADLEAIRQEKLTIASGLDEDGVLILPDSLEPPTSTASRIITFGFSETADVRGRIRNVPSGSEVTVVMGEREYTYTLATRGEHRVMTSMAVFAVLVALGIDPDNCVAAFSELTTPPGRGNARAAGEFTIIDDSYNANPVSVRFALEALAGSSGQKVAILGEMLELGDAGEAMHQSLAVDCEALDGVVTVGEGYRVWPNELGERYWGHFDTAADINLDEMRARLEPGATVLVKGANKVFWVNGFVDRLIAALSPR